MSADEHRPSAAERHHELAMAAISRAPAPPEHTAEITRNLKGAWQGTFTVRGHDADATYEKVKALALQFDSDFPYPSANGGEA